MATVAAHTKARRQAHARIMSRLKHAARLMQLAEGDIRRHHIRLTGQRLPYLRNALLGIVLSNAAASRRNRS